MASINKSKSKTKEDKAKNEAPEMKVEEQTKHKIKESKERKRSVSQDEEKVHKKRKTSVAQEEEPAIIAKVNDAEEGQDVDLGKLIEEKEIINIEAEDVAEGFFSKKKFSEFDLHENTLKALANKFKFEFASEIQASCIPLAKAGYDILGKAKTGSGKSLAFLIPAVELILKSKFKNIYGTAVIVITPTRELAFQLAVVAVNILTDQTKCGLLIGGNSRKNEMNMLTNARPPLIIATPGRLLDHMRDPKKYFKFDNMQMLIIDEADTILKIGFEEDLKKILSLIPPKRQTLLFSATLHGKVDDLASLSLKDPQKIDVGETTTVSNLEQGVVIIEPENKFRFLYTFIRKNQDKKIMVFFSSCNAVKVIINKYIYV